MVSVDCEQVLVGLAYAVGIYVSLKIIQDNVDIGLAPVFQTLESFTAFTAALRGLRVRRLRLPRVLEPMLFLSKSKV